MAKKHRMPSMFQLKRGKQAIAIITGLVILLGLGIPCVQAEKTAGTSIIDTAAGTDYAGYGGDVGAVNAALGEVTDAALDQTGNLYIADKENNRVRKLETKGNLVTIAGNGKAGYAGDNESAVKAQLNGPTGVAVDNAGNVYVADTGNNRIRKIDSNGSITTVAGNGDYGYKGDNGPAVNAVLNEPNGVAVDNSGNIYIADTGNNCIRKVGGDGIINTVAGIKDYGYAGDGGPAVAAELSEPAGVFLDKSGNIYIADTGNDCVRKVEKNGRITTVAGNNQGGYAGDGAAATEASLAEPVKAVVDSAGNIFISDYKNNRIRKVGKDGIIVTVAGNGESGGSQENNGDKGPAISAMLSYPRGLAVDLHGSIYICDAGHYRIRKVSSDGKIYTVAGNGTRAYAGDNGLATSALLNNPVGMAVDTHGNLYIADAGNNCIRKVDADNEITTIAGSTKSGYTGDGGPALRAEMNRPAGLAIDGGGSLFIADTYNHCVRKIDISGKISTVAGTGESGFSGDGGPSRAAQLDQPVGLAVDSSGNLFIADTGNLRVRRVDAEGKITTVAGNGQSGSSVGTGTLALNAQISPGYMAVDNKDNLYICDFDYNHHRILKLDGKGKISLVAGGDQSGYSGDGGPAASALINNPLGLVIDNAGNLYFADTGNNRIRMIDNNGKITTVAGGLGRELGDGGAATNADLSQPRSLAIDDNAGKLYIGEPTRVRVVTQLVPAGKNRNIGIVMGGGALKQSMEKTSQGMTGTISEKFGLSPGLAHGILYLLLGIIILLVVAFAVKKFKNSRKDISA